MCKHRGREGNCHPLSDRTHTRSHRRAEHTGLEHTKTGNILELEQNILELDTRNRIFDSLVSVDQNIA